MAMTFKKPAKAKATLKPAKSAEEFIEAAPDGAGSKRSMKGNKRAICLTVDPNLLDQFDQYALSVGMKRGALLNFLIARAVARKLDRDELFR